MTDLPEINGCNALMVVVDNVWQVELASTLQGRGRLAHSTTSYVVIFQQLGKILWCTVVYHI